MRIRPADAVPAVRPDPGLVGRAPSEARAAFRASLSVGLGFVPLGLAFGALVVQSGLGWWWAGLSAVVAFGGSFEFLLIGLVVAVAPLASVAVAALMVNLRHVFYALSFPLHRVEGRLGKAYSTFALCDEAYALASTEQARSWPGPRVLWMQCYLHLYWAGSAVAGALLGSLIPEGVTGLDFALTALFTVLALDALRELRGDLPVPLLAALSALVARVLFPGEMLLVAFALFTSLLMARRLMTTGRPSRA
ncbi:branched-chain amino acid ABC transporter permease [Streptomyces dioscori]|uniref:Branched-chain amino acid ABC transporter permease n=1 Tax=Streptomyces dioscori TaxID=2109333 RepID=A0A2P8QEW4_9ACTN|nr:AzlC family ABC transporter permease [Streptomyces dioscori]PSM44738.1 branched-chain amino acid ABC transporter permease [Streptomyces dioscori]